MICVTGVEFAGGLLLDAQPAIKVTTTVQKRMPDRRMFLNVCFIVFILIYSCHYKKLSQLSGPKASKVIQNILINNI